MRRFRQLCAAIALASILAISGSAGDMSCGVTDEQSTTTQQCAGGDISCGVTGETQNSVEYTDPVTGLAISLLTTILPLI